MFNKYCTVVLACSACLVLGSEEPSSGIETSVISSSNDLQTAESSYYHNHYPHDNYDHGHGYGHGHGHGHSNVYNNKLHSTHGHDDDSGYKSNVGLYGNKYGSYGNGNDLDYFNKGGGLRKGADHVKSYKGGHSAGNNVDQGHHVDSTGHINKGHKDRGYKNVHHKEEYGFTKSFEDDAGKKLYQSSHDDFDKYHDQKKNGGYSGTNYLDNHHHNKYGAKGADEHGHYNDNYKTAKGGYGSNNDYGQGLKYGQHSKHVKGKGVSHGSRFRPHHNQHHQHGWTPNHFGSHGYSSPVYHRGYGRTYGRPSTGFGSSHRHGYGSGIGYKFSPLHYGNFGHGRHGHGTSYVTRYGH